MCGKNDGGVKFYNIPHIVWRESRYQALQSVKVLSLPNEQGLEHLTFLLNL